MADSTPGIYDPNMDPYLKYGAPQDISLPSEQRLKDLQNDEFETNYLLKRLQVKPEDLLSQRDDFLNFLQTHGFKNEANVAKGIYDFSPGSGSDFKSFVGEQEPTISIGKSLGFFGGESNYGEDLVNQFLSKGEGKELFLTGIREQVKKQLQDRLSDIQRTRGETGEQYLTEKLGAIKQREGELGKSFLEAENQYDQAVDKQLAGLLEETGFNANIARSQVGASLAGRGLTRSTANQNALGQVSLAEQQQKAQQRLGAANQKQAANQALAGQFRAISQARRRAEVSRNLQDIQSAQDITFQLDQQQMMQNFRQRAVDYGLNAQDQAQFEGLLGSIWGSLAKAFITGAAGGG